MDRLSQPESTAAAGDLPERALSAAAGSDSDLETPVTAGDSDEDLVGEDAKLGAVAARISQRSGGDTTHTTPSDVSRAPVIPQPPFWGSKVVEITDLTKVFAFINETALFKGQWQYKQGRKTPEEYRQILDEIVYPKFA